MKCILVDGDILVYRAGFAVQSNDDNPPVSHALQAVKMMLNNLHYKNAAGAKDLEQYRTVVYLTSDDSSNFRYKIAKTKPYKGNRTKARPIHYDAIREYLIVYRDAELVFDMEADDALGITQMALSFTANNALMGQTYLNRDNSTIVTIDKDLDQIPGWHYNFVKDKRYYVSKRWAYQNFCEAMLKGDAVDNIRGYEGIGPVKARQAMAACRRDKKEMIQAVYDLYVTKYNEEYFMEMGNLLWIRREERTGWEPDLETLRKNRSHVHMVSAAASKDVSPCKLEQRRTMSSLKSLS